MAGFLIVVFTFIYFSRKCSIEYRQTKKEINDLKGDIKKIKVKLKIGPPAKPDEVADQLKECEQKIDNKDMDKKWPKRLYNCFYFSVMTFTTVGYGDYSPKGGFKLCAMIEGVLGWLTMALFLVTLGNVWLR